MAVPHPITARIPKVENILLPTDMSDDSVPVLPYVGQIARAFAAQVYLCHIRADVPLTAGLAAPQLYEAEGKEAAKHLAEFRKLPALRGLEARLILAAGTIEQEMQKLIAENNIDLVMVGTHGRTGLAKMMLGSVAEEICRVATCPVFTASPATKPAAESAFKNILFPTNLSEVSKKTLPYIALLAAKYGSRVTVLHVVQQGGAADREKQVDSIRIQMGGSFGPLLQKFQPEFIVEPGNTADTVLRVAREKQAGLIALGIRNAFRPGILVERTAYKIMAGAHCPVLTVP
ncbi:MAG TPA: universal stress protein [Candidatus Angelobacter sp.]|nr:universal stress protein [Candidatus Angelobacter sp.]